MMRKIFFVVMLGTAILTTSSLFAMQPQDNSENRSYKKAKLRDYKLEPLSSFWEPQERKELGTLASMTKDLFVYMVNTQFSIPELGVLSSVSTTCMELSRQNKCWVPHAPKLGFELNTAPNAPAVWQQIKSYFVTFFEKPRDLPPSFLHAFMNSPLCPHDATTFCFKTWGEHWHMTSQPWLATSNANEQDKKLDFKEFSLDNPVKFSLLANCPMRGETRHFEGRKGRKFPFVCNAFIAQIIVLIDDKGQRTVMDQAAIEIEIEQKNPGILAMLEAYNKLPEKRQITHEVIIKNY